MTISKVSFLGASQAQIARLKDLNATLLDLQRQMATRKKHDTLAGFSTDAQNVLRNRADRGRVQSYLANVDTVTTRINAMNTVMQSVRDSVGQIVDGITTAVHESASDIPALAQLAKNVLAFVLDNTNFQIDGRYLFAGSDTASRPFTDKNLLNANFQAEITDWLDGTITTAQLISNANAFTATDLGLNPGLSASGQVSIRLDNETELDYTVKADDDGFQDIIRALALMANLKEPGPGDTPTAGDADEVLQTVMSTARAGIKKLDAANTRLGTSFNLLKEVRASHERDVALYENLISDAEDADTTEVVTQVQLLQTQLQASYEVTRIVSQLSLVNYL